MEFQVIGVPDPFKPASGAAKPPLMRILGLYVPGKLPSERSLAAGLVAPVVKKLSTAFRLKPTRALLTSAGLKTWVSSRAAMSRPVWDNTVMLLKASG